jgi:hypothetical protein
MRWIPVTRSCLGVAVACGVPYACTPLLSSLDATFDQSTDGGNGRAGASGISLRQYLKRDPPTAMTQFGYVVAATDDAVVVAAPFEDVERKTSGGGVVPRGGAAYLYERSRGFSDPVRVVVPNVDADDAYFLGDLGRPAEVPPREDGWGGLRLAINEDVLAVGVVGEDSGNPADATDNSAPDAGAVYVYRRRALDAEPQYLKSPAPHTGAGFGVNLAVSGSRLVIGAMRDPSATNDPFDTSAPSAGAVYVYEDAGRGYELKDIVKAPLVQAGDQFGTAVAIDGDLMVVGAPTEDGGGTGVTGDPVDDSVSGTGAAFVYRYSSGKWKFEAYLKPELAITVGFFGFSAAISGNRIVIGAPNAAVCGVTDLGGPQRGAVHVFVEADGRWSPETCLNPHATGRGDLFGWVVDIKGDRIVAGAPWDGSDPGSDPSDAGLLVSGAAYSFVRSQGGQWREEAFIKAANATIGDVFGHAIALTPDLLAVGAPQQSGASLELSAGDRDEAHFSGAAYLYDIGRTATALPTGAR